MNEHSIKYLAWILVISVGCMSCGQKPGEATATDGAATTLASSKPAPESVQSTNPSANLLNAARINGSEPPENVRVSTMNGETPAPTQPWFYTTNGSEKLKTLVETREGQVMSLRTFDGAGNLKWMDQFSYNSDMKKPIEMRRTKQDGSVIQVLYNYSSNGQQTRIVIGSDGRVIPAESQDAYLSQ